VALGTILVVDYPADVLELTASILEEAGYAVLRCADGRAALPVLRDGHAIDLLLTEIAMPGGMDGFELARQARVARPLLPVAFLTGQALSPPDAAAQVFGPILQKPYRRYDLVQLVEERLDPTEDLRLVQHVAVEMMQRHADALERAKDAEEIDRAKGDELSAEAWHNIADAIQVLQIKPGYKI
jgi:CheY-like chemotaxis protein